MKYRIQLVNQFDEVLSEEETDREDIVLDRLEKMKRNMKLQYPVIECAECQCEEEIGEEEIVGEDYESEDLINETLEKRVYCGICSHCEAMLDNEEIKEAEATGN